MLETKRVSCCWMGVCRATTLAWRSLAGCDMCASCYCPVWWSQKSCTLTVARCWYTAQMAGECTVFIDSAHLVYLTHSLADSLSSSFYALSLSHTQGPHRADVCDRAGAAGPILPHHRGHRHAGREGVVRLRTQVPRYTRYSNLNLFDHSKQLFAL